MVRSSLKFFCLTLAMQGTFLLAAENQAKDTVSKENTTPAPQSVAAEKNSAEARADKKFGVAGRVGLEMGMTASGVEGFYRLSPDLQLGLQYMQGSESLASKVDVDPTVSLDKLHIQGQTALAIARYFVCNSLNIYAAAGQRTINWEFAASSKLSLISMSAKGKTTSIVAGAGIGNTWSWDNGFFLGADWFGAFVPLSSSASSSVTRNGFTENPDFDDTEASAENVGRKLGKANHYQLLSLNVGWAF